MSTLTYFSPTALNSTTLPLDINGSTAQNLNSSFPLKSPFALIARLCYCGRTPKSEVLCGLVHNIVLFNANQDLNFSLPNGSKYAIVLLYSVIITLSLFGNTLVVMSFALNRHMRSTTNMFILSLALSDILLTITTIPFNLGAVFTKSWMFGSFACKLVPGMMTFFVANSSLTLCCIAFDRFYAIVYPFKVRFFQATTRTIPLLVLVWIISLVAATPQAVYYKLVQFKSICGEITEVCLSPVLNTGTLESLYLWLPFTLLFALPLTIMGGLYGIIIRKLWKKRQIGVGIKVADSFRVMQKKRAIKMLIVVLVVFVVCWFPIQCFLAISAESTSLSADKALHLKMYFHVFALSSCCYNPIVYAFMNENFRKTFKAFLRCRRRRVQPMSTVQITEPRSMKRLYNQENQTSRETQII